VANPFLQGSERDVEIEKRKGKEWSESNQQHRGGGDYNSSHLQWREVDEEGEFYGM